MGEHRLPNQARALGRGGWDAWDGVRRRVGIALHDPSAYVRSQAQSAVLDLQTFLGWEFDSDEEA